MILSDFYTAVAEWVREELVIKANQPNLKLFQARQNVPQPKNDEEIDPVYVTIAPSPTLTKIGHAYIPDTLPDDEELPHVTHYQATIQIRESNGIGENLRILGESVEKQSVRDFLNTRNLSYLSQGDMTPIPRINEREWKEEYLLEVTFLIAVSSTEESTWIETIDLINEIGE
jgi:hypothetical protein